jgi:hypothetical protein
VSQHDEMPLDGLARPISRRRRRPSAIDLAIETLQAEIDSRVAAIAALKDAVATKPPRARKERTKA